MRKVLADRFQLYKMQNTVTPKNRIRDTSHGAIISDEMLDSYPEMYRKPTFSLTTFPIFYVCRTHASLIEQFDVETEGISTDELHHPEEGNVLG
jgi:hypothetical protein